jgi:polysaccharide biosynthesis transport protein
MQPEKGLPALPPAFPVRSPQYLDISAGPRADSEGWSNEAEGGWRRHWQVFTGHKILVILLAVLGVVGGFAMFVPKLPVYSAATTLELQPINGSFMNMAAVDPMAGASDATLNAQTQISIIRSNSIVQPAMERLERENPSVVSAPADPFSKVRARLGIVPKEPVEAFKDALGEAAFSLGAWLIPNTRIIEVSCQSTIPEVAANFVNAIASEFMYQSMQARSRNAQTTSQWLAGQLEETKARLGEAEGKLQEFVRKSGNMFASDSAGTPETLSNSKLRQLQNDLAVAQTDRINKQTLYQASLSRPIESFPPELSGRLNEYNAEVTKLQGQLAALNTTLTPNHYRVQEVNNTIAELERARERERKNVLTRIQGDYEAAMNREQLLQKAYAAQAGTVSGEADKASQYGTLKREVQILQQQLNGLLQQSNQTAIASAVPVNSARVVDPARPPALPTGPSMIRHLATGLVLGAAFGYLGAMLKDGSRRKRMLDRFGLPGYASRVLNIPELGVIPSAEVKSGKMLPLPRLAKRNGNGAGRATNGKTGTNGKTAPVPEAVELVTWREKPSLLAESFRLTLASLTRRETNGAPPAILLVTSPGPGEGKTTVATNIAIARAETNRRVLLLETDLRRPRLASIFGLANPSGWSDLILEEGEFRPDMLERLIQHTDVPHLYALGGGTIAPEHIHRVFNSPKVPLLLAALRRQFDMVVIDTPPALRFPEARLIGRLSDGVVLVLRSDYTDRMEALAAQEKLWEDGIPILGTVLNDWNPNNDKQSKNRRYGYGGYAAYYRYQGEQGNPVAVEKG